MTLYNGRPQRIACGETVAPPAPPRGASVSAVRPACRRHWDSSNNGFDLSRLRYFQRLPHSISLWSRTSRIWGRRRGAGEAGGGGGVYSVQNFLWIELKQLPGCRFCLGDLLPSEQWAEDRPMGGGGGLGVRGNVRLAFIHLIPRVWDVHRSPFAAYERVSGAPKNDPTRETHV